MPSITPTFSLKERVEQGPLLVTMSQKIKCSFNASNVYVSIYISVFKGFWVVRTMDIQHLTLSKHLLSKVLIMWLNVKVKVTQSCPTHCYPMEDIVLGILQARVLEWVAFPFSRGSSQPRDWTQVYHIAGGLFTHWATREAQEYWSK